MSDFRRLLLFVLLSISAASPSLVGQVAGFEKVTTGPLATTPGESLGFAWGDLDGDGDLDLVVANGVTSTDNQVFINAGNGVFTQDFTAPLAADGGISQDVRLADIDGDGDLDVFVANRSGNNALYRNAGGLQGGVIGTFIKAVGEPLVSDGGDSRAARFADIDGDGDLDLFVANSLGQNNALYRNLGGAQGGAPGTFQKVFVGAVVNDGGNSNGADFADIDGDGDLDLFVGNTNNQDNFLYLNDGTGNFTRVTGVPPADDGGDSYAVVFGDLDGDGDADLIVGNLLQTTGVYLNQGGVQGGTQGSFVRVLTGALATTTSTTIDLALGDYDNDGDLDLAVANCCSTGNRLWKNTGSGGQFTLESTGPVAADAGASSAVGFADHDGDGDLDLYIANSTSTGGSLNFQYRNSGPGAFTKVTDSALATDVLRHFDFALGDIDGDGDIDAFVANTDNENNALFTNDGGRQSGVVGSFTRVLSGPVVTDGGDSWGAEWGDADGDGDLDLAIADRLGSPNNNNALYFNLGGLQGGEEGTFFKAAASPISNGGGTSRDVAWGDMDGDGDLDLVFANSAFEANFLYVNQGGAQGGVEGLFIATTNAITAAAGENYGVAWADKDGDGDLDLFIANRAGNNALLTNAGGAQGGTEGVFTADTTGPVVNDGGNSFAGAWGDIDGDSDLDLFVSNGDEVNFLYVNQGGAQGGLAGAFVRVLAGPVATDVSASRQAAFADIDSDGDLDLFVPNALGADNFLYLNDGSGNLTAGGGVVVNDGGNSRDADFADLDNDGDLDLIVANQNEVAGYYRNDTPTDDAALQSLGFALAGVKGLPILGANGTLQAGTSIAFFVVNARNSTLTGFFVGVSAMNAPFKGGVFVPAPAITLAVPTDATGFYALVASWPGGIPSGFQTWYQTWIPDAAGVQGYAATNAVVGTAP